MTLSTASLRRPGGGEVQHGLDNGEHYGNAQGKAIRSNELA